MRVYHREGPHPFCGYWNSSPVEIGLTDLVHVLPPRETLHYHPFYEYYIVLRGKGTLRVEGKTVDLLPETVVMVEPRERHRVAHIDAQEGLQCVIIKQRSRPRGKTIVREAADGKDRHAARPKRKMVNSEGYPR